MAPSLESPRHPRETRELIGHATAEANLLAALGAGRLPHAWLFAGPGGIGKATLAYRFARFLLAQGTVSPATPDLLGAIGTSLHLDPDDPVFRQVVSGGHPDFCAVERQESERSRTMSTVIRVDQIREVVRFFTLTASQGGWRIAIVDGADELNANAANALLKVLEEPPPNSLLLLIAQAASRVIPTIRSRCRTLAMRPLELEQVAEILAAEVPDLDAADRLGLATLSEGRPGRALMLASQGGLETYRELLVLLSALPALNHEHLHALGDRLARRDQAAAFTVWMDLLGLWLNRLVLTGAGRSAEQVVAEEGPLSERLLRLGGLDRWLELWEKVSRLATRAESVHLDRKHVVLNAFMAVEATARG